MLIGKVHADAIVLAIPAGGVPIGHEIAAGLGLPLDMIIVRKIQLPDNSEAGFGAVGPDGKAVFNERILHTLGLSEAAVAQQVEKARASVAERNIRFRKGRPFPELKDMTVILADDGLAAGSTMTVAVQVVKAKGALRVVIAVPTAPLHTVEHLKSLVDELYCLNIRSSYPFAVASAYRTWHDVDDAEVLALLDAHSLLSRPSSGKTKNPD
jgi:predicted phosphoribosyltransferase